MELVGLFVVVDLCGFPPLIALVGPKFLSMMWLQFVEVVELISFFAVVEMSEFIPRFVLIGLGVLSNLNLLDLPELLEEIMLCGLPIHQNYSKRKDISNKLASRICKCTEKTLSPKDYELCISKQCMFCTNSFYLPRSPKVWISELRNSSAPEL